MNKVEEQLCSILPPRETIKDDQVYIQKVSSEPASRKTIIEKSELLDKKLQEAQARETGICPARREIYAELIDELIRQVAIESPETGVLFVRIRDEINMTLSAYETIFGASISFGSRKALATELGKEEKRDKLESTEKKAEQLKKLILQHKFELDLVTRREQEEKDALVRRQQDELQFLKRNNQQLKAQVDAIMSARK
jgi:dynein light intermediate chain